MAAYRAARERFIPIGGLTLFNKFGVYFQNYLLKALSGWGTEVLKLSNRENRKNITAAVEKFFRIPNSAGKVKLMYKKISEVATRISTDANGEAISETYHRPVETNGENDYKEFPILPLTPEGKGLLDTLLQLDPQKLALPVEVNNASPRAKKSANSKEKSQSSSSGSANKKATTYESPKRDKKSRTSNVGGSGGNRSTEGKKKPAKEPRENPPKKGRRPKLQGENEWGGEGSDPDDVPWTENHKSIGTEVAAYFPKPEKPEHYLTSRIYTGRVIKYAPASRTSAKDQMYHIVWEDEDEQDYDESDFKSAVKLRELVKEGWVTEHSSLGTQVAAHFPTGIGKSTKIFTGVVARYCPPSAEGEEDQLYHIVWEDGDEQDYDETELAAGIKLFRDGDSFDAASKSSSSKGKKKERTSGGDANSFSAASPPPRRSRERKEVTPARSSERQRKNVVYDGYVSSERLDPEPRREASKAGDSNPIAWTVEHESVGRKVAQYFPMFQKTYVGEVTGYAEPSSEGARDQLYHVVWEDGDEQDFEEAEYQRGLLALKELIPQHTLLDSASSSSSSSSFAVNPSEFLDGNQSGQDGGEARTSNSSIASPSPVKSRKRKINAIASPASGGIIDLVDESFVSDGEPRSAVKGKKKKEKPAVEVPVWIEDHPAVGMKVAAFFPVPPSPGKEKRDKKARKESGKAKTKTRPFIGAVVRFCPPSAPDAGDELYHILWEDNDEQDYDAQEFLDGVVLLNKLVPLANENNHSQSSTDHTTADSIVPKSSPLVVEEEGTGEVEAKPPLQEDTTAGLSSNPMEEVASAGVAEVVTNETVPVPVDDLVGPIQVENDYFAASQSVEPAVVADPVDPASAPIDEATLPSLDSAVDEIQSTWIDSAVPMEDIETVPLTEQPSVESVEPVIEEKPEATVVVELVEEVVTGEEADALAMEVVSQGPLIDESLESLESLEVSENLLGDEQQQTVDTQADTQQA